MLLFLLLLGLLCWVFLIGRNKLGLFIDCDGYPVNFSGME